tara:strand:- start:37 stop:411 length:375 start_codon:yes stop_codon:yes gene_type:complete
MTVGNTGATPIAVTTVTLTPSNTSVNSLLSNAAASGRVYKVVSLLAANVDGSVAIDTTASVYSAAALGGTAYPIASTISVPADASLIILDSSTPVVLAADRSIGVTSGTASKIVYTITYETYLG